MQTNVIDELIVAIESVKCNDADRLGEFRDTFYKKLLEAKKEGLDEMQDDIDLYVTKNSLLAKQLFRILKSVYLGRLMKIKVKDQRDYKSYMAVKNFEARFLVL